ncbi:hypothetical protein FB567DRAFT_602854 [Paraphoma chrysanthemicola]|uniref:Uncharacterized protein n=1 Tax=Paraphoma chrysanthemicola TaxID=798071 RepID=A0A8K0R2A8_9PLEO|nr:hypothetical protein FB567DRAFT_602854 [Paraphoma chrysanthemicola]
MPGSVQSVRLSVGLSFYMTGYAKTAEDRMKSHEIVSSTSMFNTLLRLWFDVHYLDNEFHLEPFAVVPFSQPAQAGIAEASVAGLTLSHHRFGGLNNSHCGAIGRKPLTDNDWDLFKPIILEAIPLAANWKAEADRIKKYCDLSTVASIMGSFPYRESFPRQQKEVGDSHSLNPSTCTISNCNVWISVPVIIGTRRTCSSRPLETSSTVSTSPAYRRQCMLSSSFERPLPRVHCHRRNSSEQRMSSKLP